MIIYGYNYVLRTLSDRSTDDLDSFPGLKENEMFNRFSIFISGTYVSIGRRSSISHFTADCDNEISLRYLYRLCYIFIQLQHEFNYH